MASYPNGAYILSLIGGLLILIGGIVTAIVSAVWGSFAVRVIPGAAIVQIVYGVIALLLGVAVIYLATKLRSDPRKSAVSSTGVAILILAIVSLFIGGGGFFIGAVLAIIGGILAIVWKA